MKSLQILLFSFFLFFGVGSVFSAPETNQGEKTMGSHAPHPPHDHHNPDHLKYLKDTDSRRKKSSPREKV